MSGRNLRSFCSVVFLAHYGKEAEPSYAAQDLCRNVWTPWRVAEVLRQFFFSTVGTWEATFYNDSGHLRNTLT